MTPLLCACAVVITLETQKCRKRAPHSVEFNFSIICDTQKRFSQNERRRADLQNGASFFKFLPRQGRRKGFCIGTAKHRRGSGGSPRKIFEIYSCSTTQILILSVPPMQTISKLVGIRIVGKVYSFTFFIMNVILWMRVSEKMLYWYDRRSSASKMKSSKLRILPPGPRTKAFPSWSISSWSLHLFFNTLDLPHDDKHTTLDKPRENDKQSSNETDVFLFFFSESIGTAAAGPAGPAPAPLLGT